MDKHSSFFFISREGTPETETFKRVRLLPMYSYPHFKELNYKITEHKNRYFIHLDFDAFYAQVEQRDNPNLRGKPVSVGGTSDGKGIVMTASYEARALGVDTAMSVYQAKKICPDLISIPCYGPKYEAIMEHLMGALREFAPEDCIEQYSIDEMFLDLSQVVRNFSDVYDIAAGIKSRIKDLENLTVSLGCSYNKTYAKMATKLQKPDGLTIITQNDKHKIYRLPVKKMWGIGRRIERRLGIYNIFTVGDLANADEYLLRKEFGVNGIVFKKLARGEDTSEIYRKGRKEKSLNHQHTLSKPIYTDSEMKSEIRRVGEYLCRKMRDKELVAGHLYFVIRYENLRYAGDDIRLKTYTNDDREIYDYAVKVYKRLPRPKKNIKARMLGMGVFDLHDDIRSANLSLFGDNIYLPYYALDQIKYKYGEKLIRVGVST